MRNSIIAPAVIASLAGCGFAQVISTTPAPPTVASAFDLMTSAKDLPTDPAADAI